MGGLCLSNAGVQCCCLFSVLHGRSKYQIGYRYGLLQGAAARGFLRILHHIFRALKCYGALRLEADDGRSLFVEFWRDRKSVV